MMMMMMMTNVDCAVHWRHTDDMLEPELSAARTTADLDLMLP